MASEFLHRVAAVIAEHQLLEPGRPVIVAVSGGADSSALLAALCQLGYECVAAHCNYHLRGEESNRDMRAVQQLCSRLGADLYVRDFDVEERRARTGESVEMACRELRYAWFADLLDRQRAQAIAVAHHREDNVETFFLNLLRGSGIAGLSGMRWRNGYVVRPLLGFSRAEIEAYLQSQGLPFVTDSTNAQNIYARNRLRNSVLPAIESQFPGAIEGILASMACLSDNRQVYEAHIEAMRQAYFADGRELLLAELIADHGLARARIILFELLKPLGFNMSQCADMAASARSSGLAFASGGNTLMLDRGTLRLVKTAALALDPGETAVNLRRDILSPAHILVSEHPVAAFRPERNPNVAYFDSDILQGNPQFALRHWRKGDRMAPYGMTGTKLISDIFAAAKLDAAAKRKAWLLTRDGVIIWAVGLRSSTFGSILPETRRYLRLEYRP